MQLGSEVTADWPWKVVTRRKTHGGVTVEGRNLM